MERLAIQEIFFLDFKLPDRKRHNTAVWLAANFSETLFKTRYSNSKNILRDVYTEMKRRIRRVVSSSTHESRLHHGEWSDLAGSDSDQSSNTWAAWIVGYLFCSFHLISSNSSSTAAKIKRRGEGPGFEHDCSNFLSSQTPRPGNQGNGFDTHQPLLLSVSGPRTQVRAAYETNLFLPLQLSRWGTCRSRRATYRRRPVPAIQFIFVGKVQSCCARQE